MTETPTYCVTCGELANRHTGPEKFCPMIATFRAAPHPPMEQAPPPFRFTLTPAAAFPVDAETRND